MVTRRIFPTVCLRILAAWGNCRVLCLHFVVTAFFSSLHAQIAISVGQHSIDSLNTNRIIVVPVMASGSQRISDMSIVLQIASGGASSSEAFGPLISRVILTNSIWKSIAGGSEYFGPALPSQTVRFSIAAIEPASAIVAAGELFRVEIDASGFNSGEFELKLVNTSIGRTAFYLSGSEIPQVITNGLLRIGPKSSEDPASRPRLSLVQVKTGWQLAFKGESGFRYRVQWAQTPLVNAWQSATSFLGTGLEHVWLDDGSLTGGLLLGQKFYRVLQDPVP